jgi:hypothetical protein
VCILDISARGLLLQAAEPPARGAYLDVLRGHQAIVGRVVWVQGQRFGIRTQDAVPVEELIRPHDASSVILKRAVVEGAALERRASPRVTAARHEASRMLSRSIEYAVFAIFGGAIAVTGFAAVGQALGPPFDQISAALAPR